MALYNSLPVVEKLFRIMSQKALVAWQRRLIRNHCFTAFNDDHGREVYLFHEAHIDLVNKIGPIIGDVLVMDYWTEE